MASNAYANVASDTTPILVYASATGSAQAPVVVAVHALAANSAAVFLGTDSSVATTTGFPLNAGNSVSFELTGADAIWAVSAAAQNLRYIVLHK